MKVITKTNRNVGATTRLVGDAIMHNGIYVAPTTGTFHHVCTMMKKDGFYQSLERVKTMDSLLLHLPCKSTPLYFDEGCSMDDIRALEDRGYNVKTVIVGKYDEVKNVTTCVGESLKFVSHRLRENANLWKTEYTGVFYSTNSIPEISKVVYDIPNGTTIVYFSDNTKEIARLMDGDTFNKEQGVLQCIAKKMYGSRSAWLKQVVNSGVEVKPKKVKNK